jgi:hypothetical protein
VGDRGGPLYDGLQELLWTDGLAEMNIEARRLPPTSEQYAAFVREFGLAQDSAWALALPAAGINRYRCVLQGKQLPTVEDIQDALEQAGVKSPIKAMRDFIKQHPGHLHARTQLLKLLRETAEKRTRHALNLGDVKDPYEYTGVFTGTGRIFYFYHSLVVDTSALDGKKLEPEQDTMIWGPYAQELQTLFASGDWRLIDLSQIHYQLPCCVCSPTMIQLYRRNIGKIETFIEEFSESLNVWRLYGWMASITKHNSTRALLDRLAPPPGALDWPPEYVWGLLVSEEEAKGNWGYIAETLWSNWHVAKADMPYLNDYFSWMPSSDKEAAGQALKEKHWAYYARPLLESLIRTNRVGDAETVILGLAKYPALRDFQNRAASLALKCDRQDLQAKWSALQIPEGQNVSDFLASSEVPCLLIIYGNPSYSRQAASLLSQGQTINWKITDFFCNPERSELVRQREGWPEGAPHWALRYKDKILAHGPDLPTEEALVRELESSGVQTYANILRRFIRDQPAHFRAKEMLLGELKRLAEHKSKRMLGEDAGTNGARMLPDADDYAVWNEYASLYRQLFPILVEQGGKQLQTWHYGPYESELFMHSQIMKNLAHSLMPQLEACLKRQPTDQLLWDLWSSLSVLNEHRYFNEFKYALAFSPLDSQASIPFDVGMLLKRYRARSDWQGIIDLQEWNWEIWRGYLEQNPVSMANPDLMNLYLPHMRYLLEAYLNLGKTSDANELARYFSQTPNWQQHIKQNFVDMAKKCGKDALAEQWGKL